MTLIRTMPLKLIEVTFVTSTW